MYDAASPHTLVILFKGMVDENETNEFIKLLNDEKIKAKLFLYTGGGFDIDTYYWIAQQLEQEYLFFLNSNSVILHDNWLLAFTRPLTRNTGVIAATASYQSYVSAVFQKHSLKYEYAQGWLFNFRKYKLLLKAFFYWRLLFPSFPNPHVRTNAFIINRKLLLSLKKRKLETKMDAFRFESGRDGFSAQLIKKGYEILVVDRNGKTYRQNEWPVSETFRIGRQQNLLIADNQTALYDTGTDAEKRLMTKITWGV